MRKVFRGEKKWMINSVNTALSGLKTKQNKTKQRTENYLLDLARWRSLLTLATETSKESGDKNLSEVC